MAGDEASPSIGDFSDGIDDVEEFVCVSLITCNFMSSLVQFDAKYDSLFRILLILWFEFDVVCL